jgi:hypothetical protein
MARLTVREIKERARSIIASHPGGIRYTALVTEIVQQNPETKENTIYASVSSLDKDFPDEVTKPSRGLFAPARKAEDDTVSAGSAEQVGAEEVVTTAAGVRLKESDFYEPFAKWLKNELGEVTRVAPLGGGGIRGRWNTPDVVGTYKKQAGSVIEFPIEIVSAEVKIQPGESVVAFGQAIAYRLFSTKTFIAMPTTLTEEDRDRLDALCMLFGVGLILFDLNKDKPQFTIRARAQRFSPDMFYANAFADRLRATNLGMFNELFG